MVTRSPPIPPASLPIHARQIWAANRFWMETQNLKSRRHGGERRHHWYALETATKVFELGLRVVGGYQRGYRNATRIAVRDIDHPLPRLPRGFDGFTIAQLSDLHLDGMPEVVTLALDALAGREFDLCALTGDFRTELHGPIGGVVRGLTRLVAGLRARHGIVGVLGNHDDCHMVAPIEELGVRLLINEEITLARGGDTLQLVGTDDPHYFYTDQALHALERAGAAPCSVALIHSPELYDAAAEQGIDLYLCGHTHGGQICLPGGVPVITHLNRGRRFFRGLWHYRRMRGYTSSGVGTSGIPIRFNTQAEIAVHHLRRA